MKVCFCTPQINFRVLKREFIGEGIPANILDPSLIKDLPFIGFIQTLKSDFKYFENISNTDLLVYDYIFYVSYADEIPNLIIQNPNKFIYIPTEPQYVNCYNNEFLVLNTYLHKNYSYENVFFHNYVYDLNYFSQFKKDIKENKIFRQKRSSLLEIKKFGIMEESFGNKSYWDYFQELSKCKYSYSLCKTESPGQTTADSSIVGVLNFATPNKIMAQKCLPEYCLVEDEVELEKKILELENDEKLYLSLTKEMTDKVSKNLSLNSFKDTFFSFVT